MLRLNILNKYLCCGEEYFLEAASEITRTLMPDKFFKKING